MSKKATKTEKAYMGIVAQMPCSLCGAHGVELHHAREDQGGAQKAGNFLVIPVCADCHRGSIGIHGDKTMLKVNKVGEMDLLNQTIGMVFEAVANVR